MASMGWSSKTHRAETVSGTAMTQVSIKVTGCCAGIVLFHIGVPGGDRVYVFGTDGQLLTTAFGKNRDEAWLKAKGDLDAQEPPPPVAPEPVAGAAYPVARAPPSGSCPASGRARRAL